jgi:hypothetical protein
MIAHDLKAEVAVRSPAPVRLRQTVRIAYDHVPHSKKKFEAAGVHPENVAPNGGMPNFRGSIAAVWGRRGERRLLCRFSDAGGDEPSTRWGGRRLKGAKARNRGKWGTVGAAGSMGI